MNNQIESALALSPQEDAARRAAERFTARAAEEGLLDVAYATVDSPVGPLFVARTKRGLVEVAYPDTGLDRLLGRLSTKISPRVLDAPGELDEVRRELDEYFEGRRVDFDLPLDWGAPPRLPPRG